MYGSNTKLLLLMPQSLLGTIYKSRHIARSNWMLRVGRVERNENVRKKLIKSCLSIERSSSTLMRPPSQAVSHSLAAVLITNCAARVLNESVLYASRQSRAVRFLFHPSHSDIKRGDSPLQNQPTLRENCLIPNKILSENKQMFLTPLRSSENESQKTTDILQKFAF